LKHFHEYLTVLHNNDDSDLLDVIPHMEESNMRELSELLLACFFLQNGISTFEPDQGDTLRARFISIDDFSKEISLRSQDTSNLDLESFEKELESLDINLGDTENTPGP